MRPGREPSKGWPASSLTETTDLYKPIGHGPGTEDFLGSEWTRGRVLCIVLEVHVFRLKHNRLEPDG